jgi:hypothetical protein
MELLDRYLQAVRKHLPWQRQEDIIAELRANLESQLEDKQEELGRPLTPAEAEAWIGSLGSPVQMAGHYQPQQYLIGPAIYPVYLHILRLSSMWAIIIYIVVSTITIVLSSHVSGQALADATLRLPWVLVQVAAWVTAVFAALEYIAVRHPDKCPPPVSALYAKWSPRDLPPLESKAAGTKKKRSYANAVAEIIFGFILLAWLLVVPKHPYLMFGPGAEVLHASPFRLAPVWWTFYWWIVGLNVIELAWKCIDLLRGAWENPDQYRNLVAKFFGLIPIVMIASLHSRMYVLLRNPEADFARHGHTLDSINQGVHMVALLLAAIVGLQLIGSIAQTAYRAYRERAIAR